MQSRIQAREAVLKRWDEISQDERRRRTLAFIDKMKSEIPGFGIHFKDDAPHTIPWRDRLLHRLARIFTPEYDSRYTTVLHPRIYFPTGTRHLFEASPERFYVTLRHEYVHLKDFERYHLWMAVSYPVLLPVAWTMRGFWELRGYTQNLICEFERTGTIRDETLEVMADIFAGRGYFYMVLPRRRAMRILLSLREDVLSGKLSGPYPYP